MVYEDFTDYVEVDPNNYWSQTTTRNTATNLLKSDDSYLYKDYGSGHFGDFEHLIDFCMTASVLNGWMGVWALVNAEGSYADMANDVPMVSIGHYADPANRKIVLRWKGGESDEYTNLSLDTTYYLTIKRSGTTLTCKIYSDAARTTLLDTLTVTCGTGTFQYLEAGFSLDFTGTETISAYVENLDLQEVDTGASALSSKLIVQTSTSIVFSSSFDIRTFFIHDVTCSPDSVQRSGTNTTELRCDWHDEEDLLAEAYTCKLYVRGPPPDEDVYGPFNGNVTKEGAKEYHATYDWDPPLGADLGLYDLKAVVHK